MRRWVAGLRLLDVDDGGDTDCERWVVVESFLIPGFGCEYKGGSGGRMLDVGLTGGRCERCRSEVTDFSRKE